MERRMPNIDCKQTIFSNDVNDNVQQYESQRRTDEEYGSGRMTGHEMIDGKRQQPISEYLQDRLHQRQTGRSKLDPAPCLSG